MTTKQPEKFPPRCWVSFWTGKVSRAQPVEKDGEPWASAETYDEYLSLEEATAMAREARASAFEECAQVIKKDTSLDETPRITYGANLHTYNMFMERAASERKEPNE